jgi:dimethylargininase
MTEPLDWFDATSYHHALVRPPGQSYAHALSSTGVAPDVNLARAQHAQYCQALGETGLNVEILPPDERYPDSCFVEDPLIVIDGQAVLTRPGALSRQGEEVSLGEVVKGRFPTETIQAPGTLEGGDVLHLLGRVLVGLSARTNQSGIDQLSRILAPHGLAVEAMPVTGYLHLLSAVAYLGRGVLLAVAGFAENPVFSGLDVLTVPVEEAYAANALAIGNEVILPEGFPLTAELIRSKGFKIRPVPVSQFAAADGGVSCLSVLW